MRPIEIDVFSPLPEAWGLCSSCELLLQPANLNPAPFEAALEAYPPEFLADYRRLSETIRLLADRFGERVVIRLWDPRSLQGLARAVRYRLRRYPAFVIAGQYKVAGFDLGEIQQRVQQALEAQSQPTEADR